MYPLTFSFEEAGACLAIVGGKGTNLAKLMRGGFAVPPGFFVTTAAYHAFVSANQINDRILSLARSVTPDDSIAFEQVSKEIRALFSQSEMPGNIASAITSAYVALSAIAYRDNVQAAGVLSQPRASVPWLGQPLAVAVRSSSTAEDLPDLSFAGQQETFLNVVGAEAVCQAVQTCWGSLWTARALSYRARHNIGPDALALAVVVQQMIASESSGVLFTANPLTESRNETIIEASFGLGEAIVSGEVEPDRYVVNSQEWRITARKLGTKAISVVPLALGGTERLTQDNAHRQALSDEQILELAKTAHRVAGHFGAPQDIEWAWADGRWHFLQSRPITSLYPLPTRLHRADDLRVYFSWNALQGIMEPLSPMGRAALRMFAEGIHPGFNQLVVEAGGRLFTDVTGPARDKRLRKILLGWIGRFDPAAQRALIRLIAEGRMAPKRRAAQPQRRRLSLRRLKAYPKMMKGLFKARPLVTRILTALLRPDEVRARSFNTAEAYLAHVKRDAGQCVDLSTCLTALECSMKGVPARIFAPTVPAIVLGVVIMSFVEKWLARWCGLKPGASLQLMRGLPGNVTLEMDLELWALAQNIRANQSVFRLMRALPVERLLADYCRRQLPQPAQIALEEFLEKHGMRGVAEVDLGRPRWRDDPSFIMHTLHGYLQLEDLTLAPDAAFQRSAELAESLRARHVAGVRKMRGGFLRARVLDGAIRRMRRFGALREIPKLYLSKILDTYRLLFLERGRELTARGVLAAAEDIFFVPLDDLRRFVSGAALDLKEVVDAERALYNRECARKQIPRLLLSTGEAIYEDAGEASADDLIGDAVSPGVVEGYVHVVLNPHSVRLAPGEILVCPSTDPGWTPLFLTAGGLVMELGGLVSHGSVVAREYGIPAVVGLSQATRRLRTGQRVRLDGSTGRVTVLDAN